MAVDVMTYLRGASEQLYRAALELMSRAGSGQEASPKEVRELAAALREILALRELTAPGDARRLQVVFEGGDAAWSR